MRLPASLPQCGWLELAVARRKRRRAQKCIRHRVAKQRIAVLPCDIHRIAPLGFESSAEDAFWLLAIPAMTVSIRLAAGLSVEAHGSTSVECATVLLVFRAPALKTTNYSG